MLKIIFKVHKGVHKIHSIGKVCIVVREIRTTGEISDINQTYFFRLLVTFSTKLSTFFLISAASLPSAPKVNLYKP